MSESIYILAIESSCDDTSAAIFKNDQLLSNIVSNQIEHKSLGGVVPEIASRAHLESIVQVVDLALKEAKIDRNQIDVVGYTQGPGLLGSLLVGAGFAKGFAISTGATLVAVDHMEAHVLAHFIEEPKPQFPFLCLTVSGGHTQIVKMTDHFTMEILGKTIDDAAGEAFDKSGKMLGLDYPSGPIIDKMAKEGNPIYEFAKPKITDLDFSFSGLKTSILYFLKKRMKENPEFINQNKLDLCASIQHSIVNILITKLEKAIDLTGITEVAIAGGVSANSLLRSSLSELSIKKNINTYTVGLPFCVDNAAMIGITAYHKFKKGMTSELHEAVFTRR